MVAKIDRLARNLHFLSTLMEAGIELHFYDLPEADRFTLHIVAAVAEHEARLTSGRIKAALAQAKRRGVKLGAPHPERYAHKGAAGRARVADAFAATVVAPALARLRRKA